MRVPGAGVLAQVGRAAGSPVRTAGAGSGRVAGLLADVVAAPVRRVSRASAGVPAAMALVWDGATGLMHRRRRVVVLPERMHVELRDLGPDDLRRFAEAVEPALAGTPGVSWARVHVVSHRLIVGLHGPADPAPVCALIDAVEDELRLADRPFHEACTHAADAEPIVADLAGIAADLAGVAVGSAARLLQVRAPPIEVDLAVLLSVIDQVVPVHRGVQRRIGKPATDLAVGFGSAMLTALASGPAGPGVDLARRVLLLQEIGARRRAWYDAESRLFADPPDPGSDHLVPPQRPVALPEGPLERYARRASAVSGLGMAATLLGGRGLQTAVHVLYSGLPRAAGLGREGYTATLSRALARRGMIPIDPAALRLLDRIDTVAVAADIVGDRVDQVTHAALTAACAAAGLDLVVVADGEPESQAMLDTVRELQQRGRTVAAVSAGATIALAAADLGIGMSGGSGPVPWGAHLLSTADPADLFLLLHAAGEARRVSAESVRIAAAGSGLGALLELAGLPGPRTAALPATSAAAGAIALGNGYRRAAALVRNRAPGPPDPTPWHALEPAQVLRRLGSGPGGLTQREADARRLPELASRSLPVSVVQAFVQELANPLTPVLGAAAGLSALAGSPADAVLVSSVVLGNSLLGGAQRVQTDRAAAALLRQRPERADVLRGGASVRILPKDLVRGDIVRLRAGQSVPADCRILTATGLEADESALTGESVPTAKDPAPVSTDTVAERTSMLYQGTWIAAGDADAVVVASGEETEARRALHLAGAPPDSGVEERLSRWTAGTLPIALGGGAALIVSGLLRGSPVRDTLATGVSLAVAAVPEGLPLLATVAQLAAARRLARHQVLVRNPRAVEALGRVDVLCADKTGTLTRGHLVLRQVSDGHHHAGADDLDATLLEVLAAAARATPAADRPADLPHPTDRAVARAAEAHGIRTGGGEWRPAAVLPFAPERGFHAAAGRSNGVRLLAVKGAPEAVLPRCATWRAADGRRVRLGEARRSRVLAEVAAMAADGLRVLAVAEGRWGDAALRGDPAPRDDAALREDLAPRDDAALREDPAPRDDAALREDLALRGDPALRDDAVNGLTLLGLIALADPARGPAAAAVASLRAAGVDTIMITGDHPSTARGIGTELGLLDGAARILTGADIDALDEPGLAEAMRRTRVVARVTPAHKVRIVKALQSVGRTVAMTGDGANDAPAIRLADVGIALGRRGTTAAQSAADMVVLDDRIETLVEAVTEGRALWGSVRDAVALLVGGNLGEILFTVLGSVVSGTSPLNARQLLLVNLLTDALPALALASRRPSGVDPAELLREGPDRSLGDTLTRAVLGNAIGTTVGAGSAWTAARLLGPPPWTRTVAMTGLIGTQLGQTLVAAHRDPVVLGSAVGSAAVLVTVVQTPVLGGFFGCVPLGPLGWSLALGGSVAGAVAGAVAAPRLPQAVVVPAGAAVDR